MTFLESATNKQFIFEREESKKEKIEKGKQRLCNTEKAEQEY